MTGIEQSVKKLTETCKIFVNSCVLSHVNYSDILTGMEEDEKQKEGYGYDSQRRN